MMNVMVRIIDIINVTKCIVIVQGVFVLPHTQELHFLDTDCFRQCATATTQFLVSRRWRIGDNHLGYTQDILVDSTSTVIVGDISFTAVVVVVVVMVELQIPRHARGVTAWLGSLLLWVKDISRGKHTTDTWRLQCAIGIRSVG